MGDLECSGACLSGKLTASDWGTLATPQGPVLLLKPPAASLAAGPPAPWLRTLEE
jgi:hypothetical protein